MVSKKEFIDYFNKLYEGKAIYLWGANAEVITKALTDRLYSIFGSSTYNKAYYDNKFKEGQGRVGADCSGCYYPLSKGDKTAKGYYDACPTKGKMSNLPKGTPCLLFNAKFTHTGAYLGNGVTIEMKSSKDNVHKESLQSSRWAYWGIPSWLDVDAKESVPAPSKKADPVIKSIQTYVSGLGYVIKADGIYGPETKKALCKALQSNIVIRTGKKISIDGIFGPATKAACPVWNAKSPGLQKDDGTYIIQAMLYCKGYDMKSSIEGNDLDKQYGKGTEKAVYQYQQNARGLRHDGEAGPSTLYSLFNS